MPGWLLTAGIAGAQASPPEEAVVRALSQRDPITCAEVRALSAAPQQALEAVVDTVQAPAWAPMRAAQCLMELFPAEAQGRLEAWVTDPSVKGLGRLVLAHLDGLPVEVAVAVAHKALVGSDPTLATERVAAAKAAEVRALVAQ